MKLSTADLNKLFVFLIAQIALEEIDRIDMVAFIQHLIVKMGRNRSTSVTYISNHLSAFYTLAELNVELRKVGIARFIVMAMIEIDHVAV